MSPGTVRGNASGGPRRCGGVDEAGVHSWSLSVVRLEECPTERKKSRRAELGVLRRPWSYPDAGGAAEGRGVRAELSGRKVKRRRAGASHVERRSEDPP